MFDGTMKCAFVVNSGGIDRIPTLPCLGSGGPGRAQGHRESAVDRVLKQLYRRRDQDRPVYPARTCETLPELDIVIYAVRDAR
jgi:hypothetical protein